ncbi:hypothetical protein FXO38_36783, partial [Capsicum annuum]
VVTGSSFGNSLWQKCKVRLCTIHPCSGALPRTSRIAVALVCQTALFFVPSLGGWSYLVPVAGARCKKVEETTERLIAALKAEKEELESSFSKEKLQTLQLKQDLTDAEGRNTDLYKELQSVRGQLASEQSRCFKLEVWNSIHSVIVIFLQHDGTFVYPFWFSICFPY